jgi:hypothetical protein
MAPENTPNEKENLDSLKIEHAAPLDAAQYSFSMDLCPIPLCVFDQ